jgi:hypothetical protein
VCVCAVDGRKVKVQTQQEMVRCKSSWVARDRGIEVERKRTRCP